MQTECSKCLMRRIVSLSYRGSHTPSAGSAPTGKAADDQHHRPGIRDDAVSRWFTEHVDDATGPLRFERIAGGRSNLTYLVQGADGARWVLRRPPLGMARSRAHDVLREAEVLERLRSTPVPVPVVVGTCDDDAVTGAPFFVMNHLDGVVLRDPDTVTSVVPADRRPSVAAELVRALPPGLHAVDPRDVGWGGLADRDDYLARQLRRWSTNWARTAFASRRHRTRPRPPARTYSPAGLGADRPRRLPPRQLPVHTRRHDRRDSRLGADHGRRSTRRQPRPATGVLGAARRRGVRARESAHPVAGFPTRDDLVEQYLAAARPDTVPDIDFYVAYNWWNRVHRRRRLHPHTAWRDGRERPLAGELRHPGRAARGPGLVLREQAPDQIGAPDIGLRCVEAPPHADRPGERAWNHPSEANVCCR